MENALGIIVMFVVSLFAAASSYQLEVHADGLFKANKSRSTAVTSSKYAVFCVVICVLAVLGMVYHVLKLLIP